MHIKVLVADSNPQKAQELADKLPQICRGCEITFAASFSRAIIEIGKKDYDTIFIGDVISNPMDREALYIHTAKNVRNTMIWIFNPNKETAKSFADKLNSSYIPAIIYEYGEGLFQAVDFWFNEQK